MLEITLAHSVAHMATEAARAGRKWVSIAARPFFAIAAEHWNKPQRRGRHPIDLLARSAIGHLMDLSGTPCLSASAAPRR